MPVLAHAQAIWGVITVSEGPDPNGYWEYCLDIEWDTTEYGGHGLSHSLVLLGLENCAAACEPGMFAFDDIAGSGIGEGGCTVYYTGEFLCEGDPSFPEFPFPTVKFEYIEDDCEPDWVGWMHVCFYSLFPPAPWAVYPDALGIKYGTNTETGPLEGDLPMCEVTPGERCTWGSIKSIYR